MAADLICMQCSHKSCHCQSLADKAAPLVARLGASNDIVCDADKHVADCKLWASQGLHLPKQSANPQGTGNAHNDFLGKLSLPQAINKTKRLCVAALTLCDKACEQLCNQLQTLEPHTWGSQHHICLYRVSPNIPFPLVSSKQGNQFRAPGCSNQ